MITVHMRDPRPINNNQGLECVVTIEGANCREDAVELTVALPAVEWPASDAAMCELWALAASRVALEFRKVAIKVGEDDEVIEDFLWGIKVLRGKPWEEEEE